MQLVVNTGPCTITAGYTETALVITRPNDTSNTLYGTTWNA